VRKKIFMLLSRVPYPLEKGDKLRAFHQLKELSVNHDIILCTLCDQQVKPEAREFLKPYVKHHYIFRIRKPAILFRLLLNFFSDKPFQVAYFFSRKVQKQLLEIIDMHQPDFVYAQLIRTAEYIKHLPVNKTLDYQDVFSKGLYRRWQVASIFGKPFLRAEYQRVLRYEREVFDLFEKKTIISFPDRELIPHPQKRQIAVIPNGVDFDFFNRKQADKQYDIIFTGNMAYPPNINGAIFLVRSIMPYVWKHLPDTTVVLAGASPSLSVRSLESNRVFVTGWVDDMREYYSKSHVFVAPMQIGTGLQNKVLEAMAMGLPCITSTLANDALNAPEGEAVLVARNPKGFADHIITLLNDPHQREQMAENGYNFVRANYQWSKVCDKLIEVIAR
jgi:polysaccharide biosynthesis protein PslH